MIDFDDLAAAESAWSPEDLAARASRSARERERPVASWAQRGGGGGGQAGAEAAEDSGAEDAPGVLYGLCFPTSANELLEWGPAWLNVAFRVAGTLPDGIEVAAVKSVNTLSTSRFVLRLLLSVEYRPSWSTLPRELLVKLPAPRAAPEPKAPQGARREESFARARAGQLLAELSAYRTQQLAEVNAYRLLEEAGPLRMPRYFFGDGSEGAADFILIVEWLRPLEALRRARETEEASGFSLGLQRCVLQGPHGGFLASDAQGHVFLHAGQRTTWAVWTLKPPQDDHKRRFVLSEAGLFLAARHSGEHALHMTAQECDGAKWSLVPVPGEAGTVYLRSFHGTFLASLDDASQSLYMSPNEGNWENWVVRPRNYGDDSSSEEAIEEDEAAGGGAVASLDLRFAHLATYRQLIRAGARMAGLHKAGHFGPPSAVDQCFGGPASKRAARRQGIILGLGKDHDFIEKVTTAQNFIQHGCKALLPSEVTTTEAMKAFRAVITSARHNLAQIDWWCNYRRDYVALGPGSLEFEGVFTVQGLEEGGESALGLCDWASTSVSSLGQKLWQWLSRADHGVLDGRLDDLLSLFLEAYRDSGGPSLDLQLLRLHFVLSAAVELVRLLDDVPQLCQQCPSDQWGTITSFSDKRLSGPVWRVVRVLTNAAVVMTQSEIMSELEEVMTRVRIGYLMGDFVAGRARASYFHVGRKGAEVRVGPGPKQLLLCRLPAGMLACAACQGGLLPTSGDYVRLLIPVPGWALAKDLAQTRLPASERGKEAELREDFGDPCWRTADAMMLTLMYESRRQWTGRSPLHMCATSTRKLQEAIELREEHQKLQTQLGRGTCQQVAGSFLAETTPHAWWPAGYQGWCHHTFLRFEDGSIADITADQWDKHVPQLWWPADKSRYSMSPREADAARELRRMVGMDLWKQLDNADSINSVFKTRRRWTELERLQAGADQHVQPDPYTAEAQEPWKLAAAA